ncbi:spore coat protein YutH [Bacillus sp. V3B]|uniref:spore coat putative kinase YutH n=1 Tax=Bacillus sp. V3B TaxID=2804915 RepID=UPI0021087893|nr:spore coat protein YutH [Bacillus sp. V3B]MCQ6276543.1 spore coat protein YutH [Bacillus sp. V3B]
MFQKLLHKHYGIDAIESTPIGQYQSCKKEKQQFILIPVDPFDEEELTELEQIAKHFKESGDQSVGTFLYTKENSRLIEWESGKYCVLTYDPTRLKTTTRIGRKLAKFHYRGRSILFPVQKVSRIGQWKKLWEMRIDQMEKVWNNMLFQQPESEFDRMFIESFSYYMAISENAIQYLVDTELDDEPQAIDSGTVCHTRFSIHSWADDAWVRNPIDWVFDHCSRDLAEWTRERYHYNYRTYQPDVQRFFAEYQSVEPLSSFACRLLYARLLFPLHYVECVEDYYSTTSEQKQRFLTERLEKYLKHSNETEKFLQYFFQLIEVPVRTYHIPKLDWL